MSGPCLCDPPGAERAVRPRVPEVWTPSEELNGDLGSGGPPADGGDGDGGGGGGGGGGRGEPGGGGSGPPKRPRGAAELAFGLFVLAAATLFAAFLVAYALLLRGGEVAVGDSSPPRDLGAATLLVVGAALALAVAAGHRRRGPTLVRGGLFTAATMAALLLAVLPRLWSDLAVFGPGKEADPGEVVLRALLGLFGLLAAGGLGFIGGAIAAARRGDRPGELAGTLRLCGLYWQFLTGLWLVLYGVLALEA